MRPVLVLALLAAAGCVAGGPALRPATVPELSPEGRRALEAAAARLLERDRVALAPDAFASTHIAVLQPALPRDPEGRAAGGRLLEPAATLHLLGDGSRCVLQHRETGRQLPVDVTCVPDGA